MRKFRRFAAVAVTLTLCVVASNAFAGTFQKAAGPDDASGVLFTYDPADGNLVVDGMGRMLTTVEIKASGLFAPTSADAAQFVPPFDIITTEKLFKLEPAGFESLNFGAAMRSGLSFDDIAVSEVNGSMKPSGGIGNPNLYIVPEPASLALIGCGLFALLGLRRRK